MSADKPTPTALAASRVGRLLSGAEPVVTRIEFAPGHEDEAITEQDVAAKLRVMNAAPKLLEALILAEQALNKIRVCCMHTAWDATGPAVIAAREAIAAAKGR